MTAGNTRECLEEFVGQKLIGVLMGSLTRDGGGRFTLIFENKRGLHVYDSGAFGPINSEALSREIQRRRKELDEQVDLQSKLLGLAQVIVGDPKPPAPQDTKKPKPKSKKKGG